MCSFVGHLPLAVYLYCWASLNNMRHTHAVYLEGVSQTVLYIDSGGGQGQAGGQAGTGTGADPQGSAPVGPRASPRLIPRRPEQQVRQCWR